MRKKQIKNENIKRNKNEEYFDLFKIIDKKLFISNLILLLF